MKLNKRQNEISEATAEKLVSKVESDPSLTEERKRLEQ